MRKLRIFIADVERDCVQRLEAVFRNRREMEVTGCAHDGGEAYRRILSTAVDVLILDVQLPGMDGFMLLNDLRRMNRCPTSIVCTRFYSGTCVELASQCGAAYILYKPLSYERLPEIVLQCHRAGLHREPSPKKAPLDRARALRKRLAAMGIASSLSGSLYMTEGLLRLRDDPTLMKNLSKGLYAEIAPAVSATPARIERAMRCAIASAYERGSLRQHFDHKPTNREFLEFMMSEDEPS